jgi:hypothetical protein
MTRIKGGELLGSVTSFGVRHNRCIRRTGKTVKEGHRDSDGWEDFEDMWRLNDASPRPAKKIPQTPRKSYTRDFDPDDSFDMSIVQDGKDHLSSFMSILRSVPQKIMSRVRPHMRPPSLVRRAPCLYVYLLTRGLVPIGPAPSSVLHSSSLSRRVGTTRSIDFDAIPSPGKTSGLGRSSHSHSLRADLDISRSRIGERPKPRPLPKPRIPDPASSPEPDGGDEEVAPNRAVAELSSPSSHYKGNNSVSKNCKLYLSNFCQYILYSPYYKLANPILDCHH